MAKPKAQWISGFEHELKQAKKRLERWQKLGKLLHKEDSEGWKATANVRKADVEMLTLLVKSAEAKKD